jgi:FtsZ-interacting cell division protein ZipA
MVLTILIVAAIVALVAFIVVGVQKAKAEKKGIYAETEKCPYHNIKDDEVVGYETAAPTPFIVEEKPKKKAAKKAPAKKTAPKKANSSQKKK